MSHILAKKFRFWVEEYSTLAEASAVALSAHVLAFPMIWFIGWALPWPKPPEIVTVIEYDLTNFLEKGPVPKDVTDIFESSKKK